MVPWVFLFGLTVSCVLLWGAGAETPHDTLHDKCCWTPEGGATEWANPRSILFFSNTYVFGVKKMQIKSAGEDTVILGNLKWEKRQFIQKVMWYIYDFIFKWPFSTVFKCFLCLKMETTHVMLSQPQHYCHLGLGHSLWWGRSCAS